MTERSILDARIFHISYCILSAYVTAPFDEGKEILRREEYKIISLEENAMFRLHEGTNAGISRNGNWVREGVLYVPDKGIFLTKKSPVIKNAKEATACHRNKIEYYPSDEQVEESLSDCVRLLGNPIPTYSFADNPITIYAFGKQAEAYGNFLKEAGITEMPTWLSDMQKKPFVRQVAFGCLCHHGCRAGLIGDYPGLHDSQIRVRGISDYEYE